MTRIACAILILTTALSIPLSARTENPYCIAGYGVLDDLSMPADCTDYDWNGLHTERPIQMCRPNHYYDYIGIPVRWWGYNQDTGEINDPAQFQTWITTNPGKIWVISNEPDLYSQDGLTKEQYVHMFHTYYTFIGGLDPTATFAIAGITGGSTTDRLNYTTGWFQDVLDMYETEYGVTMPVDIWNVHSYAGPTQIENPDKIINDFVNPFVDWCHTCEGGAYAGAPVWITELPIGEWMGALSEDNIKWFMEIYMPRLEQTEIDKWFWFVSRSNDEWGTVALVKNNVPSALGLAYAALAHGYPNDVPAVEPFVPEPTPDYESFDFSGALEEPWFVKGGWWSIDSGALRHTGFYPWGGVTCCLTHVYGDFGISFDMKINSAQAPENWAGMTLRLANRFHVNSNGAYLFYIRQNGEVGISHTALGNVTNVPDAVADTSQFHNYRIVAHGYHLRMYVDGAPVLDWTDPNEAYDQGFAAAQVYKTDASYDNFHFIKYPTPLPEVTDDGGYTTDLSHLNASWTIPDIGAAIQGYYYAVGTEPGETDVIDWTYTTDTSVNLNQALAPGYFYYFTVKALYACGLESTEGSSDGILATTAASTIAEAKSMPAGTHAVLENKLVSGVFDDCVYIQEPDRSNGIKIIGDFDLTVGDTVSVVGKLTSADTQACMQEAEVHSSTTGEAPEAVAVNNEAAGGVALGLQEAPVDDASEGKLASGLSTAGLLIRTTGQVTYVEPGSGCAYIDDGSNLNDGSGSAGVRVSLTNCPVPADGTRAVVTACCGTTDIGGNCARLLRPRSEHDVQFDEITNYLHNSGFESGTLSAWTTAGGTGAVRVDTPYALAGIYPVSGSYQFVYANYYTSGSGCIYQKVSAAPSQAYSASVYSNVYHWNAAVESARNRIGINPTGGTDPGAASVVWSTWDENPAWASGWDLLSTASVTASADHVTVFLQYEQTGAFGHNINCFDQALLQMQ